MAVTIKFPDIKSLPPPPLVSDLTSDERNAWEWISGNGTFDTMVINLSPNLARLMLTRVGDNRKPKLATVAKYARIMTAAQWRLTHQGLAISTRIEVIDGQHRLLAVVESGVTIEVLVVRGVSQDAILFIDGGITR